MARGGLGGHQALPRPLGGRAKKLRLVAWGRVPQPGDPYVTEDPFDCRQCFIDGKWDDAERASLGCTRTDLPPVEWDVDPIRLGRYVGKHSQLKHDEPGEDIEQGCPGGWRYAPFGHSVVPNARRRTETGDRVHSPRFDSACADDPLMQLAIEYFEHEEERCIYFIKSKQIDKQREEAAARAAKNK